jgi:hypothetical protein
MKDAEMQQIMDRLAKVERQNRWLMRGGLALLLSCASILLMAQKPQQPSTKIIEAQGFVLKDAAGKVRAELHFTVNGDPELRIYGSEPKTWAIVSADKDSLGMSLWAEGSAVAGLLTSKDGPSLTLLKWGGPSANIFVNEDGPLFSLDSKGIGGSKMESSATGIQLLGPKGKTLWSAGRNLIK